MIKDCTQVNSYNNGKPSYVVKWAGLSYSDVGSSLPSLQYSGSSVQVTGTFGEGGSVVLEGSNDGETFFPIADNTGSVLHFNKSGLKGVGDVVAYVRPKVLGGDSTTSITVTLAAKA
jgi:hypothetical protein